MRRTILVFALALLSAAALSATALAKEGGVELGSTPAGIGPGDPWTPSLTLIDNAGEFPANPEPGITIKNLETGQTLDYKATPTDDPTVFTVRVVFPTPGQWDYAAYDGVTDRLYEFPAATILPANESLPTTPPPASTSSDGSFPVWPLLGGLGGAALLSAAAYAVIRNRRLAH